MNIDNPFEIDWYRIEDPPHAFTGDYNFQTFSRQTDDGSGPLDAPIQQSVGRVGVAVVC